MSTAAAPPVDPMRLGWFGDEDYFEQLAWLRAESPLHEFAPGQWTVARWADVREVSRDPQRFCSGRGVLMDDPVRQGLELPGSILHMDPPEHAEWRRLASRWFTPRAVARLEQRVREQTAEVLDGLPARLGDDGSFDAVDALAAPVPLAVIAEMLGMGDTDLNRFRVWSDALIENHGGEEESKVQLAGELLEFLGAEVTRRRAEPGEDLMSLLVAAEVQGRPLADHEVVMYAMSMLVAGNETTRHLISGMLCTLAELPEQRAALAGDQALGPATVEESLRWHTPIQLFGRTVVADTELAGVELPEGAWVVMLYASANRDEAAWGPTAGSFDLRREPNPAHVAFGFGEHLCLGAGLARLEGRVFLEELLGRHRDWELAGPAEPTTSLLVRGLKTLPLRFS